MTNEYEIRGDTTAIFLRRKDGSRLETLIDTTDLPRAMEFPFTWCAHWNPETYSFYVEGKTYNGKGQKRDYYSLHRWLINARPGFEVDHIFHDTLDNRRYNLRELPEGGNMQNYLGAHRNNSTSGIRGITWSKQLNKWQACLRANGTKYNIGVFEDIKEAEIAVKAARAKYMPYSLDAMENNIPDLNKIVIPKFESGLNASNTSGYNGVNYSKQKKKWFGKAQRNNKIIITRHYSNKEDAYKELCEKVKLLEANL